jgi:thiol-disulfide isomerase/thioredoxin
MSFLAAEQVTVGPLTLSTPAFLMLVAALAGGLIVFFRLRADRRRRRLFFDSLGTAAVVALVGWKLFPLLYSPGEMITRPMTLLYTPGGTPGLALGLALGLLYFGFKIVRGIQRGTPERHLLSPLLVFAVTFIGLSGALMASSRVLRAEQGEPPAAAFFATTLQGQEIALDQLKGKTVILNFWATWCPPCRAELPTLVAFSDEIADSDTVLIGVAVGPSQTPGAVGPFLEQEGITYPVILDTTRRIASSYGVRTLPTSVVISPAGTIRERRVGAVDRFWLRTVSDTPI